MTARAPCGANKHTNKQLNTEENIYKINYAGTNSTEETIKNDACDNDDVNTQKLTTPKFISFEKACVYTLELPVSEH